MGGAVRDGAVRGGSGSWCVCTDEWDGLRFSGNKLLGRFIRFTLRCGRVNGGCGGRAGGSCGWLRRVGGRCAYKTASDSKLLWRFGRIPGRPNGPIFHRLEKCREGLLHLGRGGVGGVAGLRRENGAIACGGKRRDAVRDGAGTAGGETDRQAGTGRGGEGERRSHELCAGEGEGDRLRCGQAQKFKKLISLNGSGEQRLRLNGIGLLTVGSESIQNVESWLQAGESARKGWSSSCGGDPGALPGIYLEENVGWISGGGAVGGETEGGGWVGGLVVR